MKKLKIIFLSTLLLFLAGSVVSAQPIEDENSVRYWEAGYARGTHTSWKLAYNKFISPDKIASLAFNVYMKNPDNVPADYSPGLTFFWTDGIPNQYAFMLSALYGKVLPQSRNMRICMKGGLSAGIARYPVFVDDAYTGFFGANYGTSYGGKWVAGLIVNPVAEFTLSDNFGIGLGLNGNINTYSPSLGLELNILLDKVRVSD